MTEREKLIELGIIIESPEELEPQDIPPMDSSDDQLEQFPDANYELQNEVIKFFNNNPGAEPEIFRQYAISIGVEPEELQRQANILMSQLLNIYTQDAESLGYGTSLTDDEVDPAIQSLVTPNVADDED